MATWQRRHFLGALGAMSASALCPKITAAFTPVTKPPTITDVQVIRVSSRKDEGRKGIYVEITTDTGLTGIHGPIQAEPAYIIYSKLRPLLKGKDPLAGEHLWDQMRRRDRHARAGQMMMAISAVDNALWDLRGKYFDVPVYRLLGGPTREKIPCYASMLGHSTEPSEAAAFAKDFFDRGFVHQKWFFDYFPEHGGAGRLKNIAMVKALRDAVGEEGTLCFDARWAWDLPYSIDMARAMMPYRPHWLEEPLHPEQLEGYIHIKRDTGIPLASGEHFYTRWNVKQYLDADAIDFVQADPEWCGGITELVKICGYCEAHEVKVVPHGHTILPAMHVIAAQPVVVCPMSEFLWKGQTGTKQHFHKNPIIPEDGFINLPTAPGLGMELDPDIVSKRENMFG